MATITPLDATLGAEIIDIDLADLRAPDWKRIENAFHDYRALVFPGQDLDADDQVAFAERFGETGRDERADAFEPSAANR